MREFVTRLPERDYAGRRIEYRTMARKKVWFGMFMQPPSEWMYEIQAAFNTYSWLAEHATPDVRFNTLNAAMSTIGDNAPDSIGRDWRGTLDERFRCVMMSGRLRDKEVLRLSEIGFHPGGARVITRPFVEVGSAFVMKLYESLFAYEEGVTRRPLNECHKRARTVYSVRFWAWPGPWLSLREDGSRNRLPWWAVSFTYGLARDRSSHWDKCLEAEVGEGFVAFLERAHRWLARWIERPKEKDGEAGRCGGRGR